MLSADSDNEVADPSDYGADYSYKDLYNATLKELQHYYPNSQIAPAEIGIPNSDNSDSHFYKCPWDYVTEVNPTINPPSYIAKELYGNLRNSNNNNPASSSMPWGRINATYNYFYNLEANLDPENNKPHPQIPHEIHQFRLENTQPTNQARNASWTFQVLMGIKAGYYYYSNDNNNNLKVNFRNPNRYDPTPYTRPNSPTSYRYPLNVQRVVGWGTTTGGNIGENLLLGNGFVYALLDRYRLAGNGVGSQILPLKPTSVKKYNTSENDVSTQASAIAFTNPNDNTLRSIVIATFGIGAGDSNARLNLNFANNAYSKVELKYNITPTIAPTIFLPLNFQNNWKLIRYQPDTYAFNCIKRDLQSRGYLDTDPFFPDDPTNTSSFSNCFFCDDDPVTMIKGGAAKTYLQSTKRNNIEPSPCDRENPNDPAPMSYTGLMTKQLTFDSLPANDEYIKTSFDANSKTLTITATIPTDAVIVLEPQP
ncbi:hypothetical protein MishRS11D_21340 [Methylomagnum ishizawai]|nr:hypothetical protein MishRS11D_21340 [Methylomagnum ishizawai]